MFSAMTVSSPFSMKGASWPSRPRPRSWPVWWRCIETAPRAATIVLAAAAEAVESSGTDPGSVLATTARGVGWGNERRRSRTMGARTGRWSKLGVPTAVVAAALTIGMGAGSVGAVHEGDYPGHIHAGSCEELGDVVFPLGNAVVGGLVAGTPEAETGEEMGSEARIPVATTAKTVDASLEDILAEEHAINFHESEENIQNYIACGDIGGAVLGDAADGGTLVIGLRSLNDSGISGVATLEAMGDQTEVVVYLAEDLTGVEAADAAGTPAASPAAAGGADEAAVTIEGYAYNPETIEIPVGGTVTWTNLDSFPHTATATEDRELLQSGAILGEKTFSQTFEEAGTYEYYCEYHANMNGTIVVQ
jgi:plastocyanin